MTVNATHMDALIRDLLALSRTGRIDVTPEHVDLEGGGARIRVRDNGRGVPEEHLGRIFGVFERLDPDMLGGTGMGLTICRPIVESAGGNMGAEPHTDGASFVIGLPAAALSHAQEPSIVMPTARPGSDSLMTHRARSTT